MVAPNGMIELLAKTFATDEILLITTRQGGARSSGSVRSGAPPVGVPQCVTFSRSDKRRNSHEKSGSSARCADLVRSKAKGMAPDRLAWPGGLGGGRIMVLQSYRQRNEKGEQAPSGVPRGQEPPTIGKKKGGPIFRVEG